MAEPQYSPGQPITTGKLYPRIFPHPAYYQNGKVTSQAFDRKHDDHLSMALADLTSPLELLAGHEGFGIFEIDVVGILAEGLEVRFDPSERKGRAHVQVRGNLPGSVRRRLARRSRVLIPPHLEGASLEER